MDPKTPETAPVGPELQAFIVKTVGEAIAPVVDALKVKATNNLGGLPLSEGRAPVTGADVKDAADGTGLHLARFVKAQAYAAMTRRNPIDVAKAWGYTNMAHQMEKALAQGVLADGGALVPEQYQAELIEKLRNETVVRRAGATQIQVAGSSSITLPKQTGAATAYWGEENTAITPSQQTLGTVTLSEKKLTALTPISNDLIRNATLSAEEMVRNDLIAVVTEAEDLKFIRGVGSASSPRGIRYWAASGNVFAETIAGADGSHTLAEVKKDAAKMINKLEGNNVKLRRPAWLFATRTKWALNGMTETTGASAFEAMLAAGRFYGGFPYYATNQIPTNLVSTDSEIYFVDMAEVLIADFMGMQVDVFPNGAWSNSGTIVSGISSDQTVVRIIKKADLIMRHDVGAAVIQDASNGV